MHALRVSAKDICAQGIVVSEKETLHHLKDVLRIKVGEKLEVFDEKGNQYLCSVCAISKEKMVLRVNHKLAFSSDNRIKITIACALPKRARFDDIVDTLTQLGVYRIIPLMTERVIVKLDKGKAGARLTRWRKIASSASQQSKRTKVPIIDPLKCLPEVLAEADGFEVKLIPTLEGERKALKDIFIQRQFSNIFVLIGPEGDFTDEEVALAKKAGFVPVTLGPLVLRVDTAAAAVVSYLGLAFSS